MYLTETGDDVNGDGRDVHKKLNNLTKARERYLTYVNEGNEKVRRPDLILTWRTSIPVVGKRLYRKSGVFFVIGASGSLGKA